MCVYIYLIYVSFFLAAGVNDSVEHAVELAKLLHEWGHSYHVNLIPFNPIEGSEFKRPYKKSVCFLSLSFLFSFKPFVDAPIFGSFLPFLLYGNVIIQFSIK